jgi:hypothetical protein
MFVKPDMHTAKSSKTSEILPFAELGGENMLPDDFKTVFVTYCLTICYECAILCCEVFSPLAFPLLKF